jgi:eukaryotic-like serine/threonine-protein kinase
MDERDCCRGCGQSRPSDAPSGLCPACLLKAGLLGDGSEIPDVTITFGPTTSSVLARFGEAFGKIPPILLRDPDSINDPGPVIRPSSSEIPDPAERSARLQLFGEIARGGMGAVLKGRDSDLGRDLAVKVLLELHRDKPEMVRRFIEEAQIAGQLQHPGIVPIYELGAFGDRRPYFAMKLVKGHTLAEILASRKSPTDGLSRFLSIFESICQTMAYAHARGVIHRDLKPSNVMVGSFGEVQVMDWGLAKVLPRGGAVDDASAGQTKDQGTVITTARSASDSDLSHAGSVMGTPSYMAPEQARGEVDQIDERADVFALGSIFCELLTGEPAFTGRSSGEIQRKASRGELKDARDRLDASVVDPELIALAKDCLAPEQEDRPRNAGEVAARINGYQTGVQERLRQTEISRAEEKARAEEATKRACVERDRLRLTVALAASVLGFALLGGGGAFWIVQQRQARLTGVETTLARIETIRDQAAADGADPARWREALSVADSALASIGDLARSRPGRRLADLRAEIAQEQAQAERDRKLIEELASLRTSVRSDCWDKKNGPNMIDRRFTRAFELYGLDLNATPIKDAVARLKSRPEPFEREVVGSLDHWLFIRHDLRPPAEVEPRLVDLKKILELAQGLDSDPERNRLRALLEQADLKTQLQTLGAMARQTEFVEFGPSTALLFAGLLNSAGDPKNAIAVLRAAVVRYPADPWTNYSLAELLSNAQPPQANESIRFYTAARALRPETGWDLARVLESQSRHGEAAALHREFVRLDPLRTRSLYDLFNVLEQDGMKGEAQAVLERMIAPFRERVRQVPNDALAHRKIGGLLFLCGDYPGAKLAYREAARAVPEDATFRRRLGILLHIAGDLPGAIAAYREAIRIDPMSFDYHYNLAAALERTGDQAGEVAALREAVRLERLLQDPASGVVHAKFDVTFDDPFLDQWSALCYFALIQFRLYNGHSGGRVLRLTGDLPGAIAAYREAINLTPGTASEIEDRYGLGIALAESGDVPGAIAAFREATQHEPLQQVGLFRLLQVILTAERPEKSIAALRRVREQARDDGKIGGAIDLSISQFEQLSKRDELIPPLIFHPPVFQDFVRTSLADQCHKRQFFAASAAVWSAGFAADPKLAEDMKAQNRYNAACSAAMAAAGKGIEKPPLDEQAKTRWRKQALDWLGADLAYWAKQAESSEPEARARIGQALQHWTKDSDLAGIRVEEAVNQLAEDEQRACLALWKEVDRLLKKTRP